MKKVGMIIIGIVMLFVIWYFGGMVYYSYFDNEPDPYAVYFKDNNFLFLEYGEDMDFSEALDLKIVNNIKKIASLDNVDNFLTKADYVCLIINDLHGKAKLDKEDMIKLRDLVDKNNNFGFYYGGMSKRAEFKEIFSNIKNSPDDGDELNKNLDKIGCMIIYYIGLNDNKILDIALSEDDMDKPDNPTKDDVYVFVNEVIYDLYSKFTRDK